MIARTTIAALSLATIAGCGGGGGGGVGASTSSGDSQVTAAFALSSTGFTNGASIPNAIRCANKGGAGNLPSLSWANLPSGTKALVVIMDDESGLGLLGQRATFTHYFALIPYQSQVSALNSIDQVLNPTLPYEKVWTTAANNWTVLSDLQPCNPESTAHTYRWTVYALNTEYNSIDTMKSFFDPIINGAINSNDIVFNLNQSSGPKFTRKTFEAEYGNYIIEKATLEGVM